MRIIYGIGICLLVTIVLHFRFPREQIVTTLKSRKPSTSPGGDNSSLLLESVIPIIQNYYLDSDKVTNIRIMKLLIKQMSGLDGVEVMPLESIYRVTYKDQTLELEITDPYRHRELVHHVSEIGHFLSQYFRQSGNFSPPGERIVNFLNGILLSLDPHSELLDRSAYRELKQGTEGAFGGLGVIVGIRNHILTVIRPIPESPAYRAGINRNDKIMTIDGVTTFGSSLDNLIEIMRGYPGSQVALSILREGALSPRFLTLEREVIELRSIHHKVYRRSGKRILHVHIDSFTSRTAKELATLFRSELFTGSNPVSGLILDLRFNPGGLLNQAVKVADLFLSSGTIVTTSGRRNDTETAFDDNNEIAVPIVLLINSETASASEILAGALQDNKMAVVIGQPSFGKGSVQTVFELPGEQALKLTIARYFTPNHRSIQDTGIFPDIWVQPILKSEKSQNLMGHYRYRRDLSGLSSIEFKSQLETWKDNIFLKGYYLSEKPFNLYDADDTNDLVFELALDLLSKTQESYGSILPEGARRSTHWLSMAAPELLKKMIRLDTDTRKWLQKNHRIDWSHEEVVFDHRKIGFHIKGGENWVIEEGENLVVPWELFNYNDAAISRVSIYAKENMIGSMTHEFLVGSLKIDDKKSGKIRIPMNTGTNHSPVDFKIGVAVDGMQILKEDKLITVSIKSRRKQKIAVDLVLNDKGGGRIDGVLEPGEEAMLGVTIRNEGDYRIDHIELKVFNFSGSQVQLDSQSKDHFSLDPDETRVLFRKIIAGEMLATNTLIFGTVINSIEFIRPERKSFLISSQSNIDVSAIDIAQ